MVQRDKDDQETFREGNAKFNFLEKDLGEKNFLESVLSQLSEGIKAKILATKY